jgi:hypothetical protein
MVYCPYGGVSDLQGALRRPLPGDSRADCHIKMRALLGAGFPQGRRRPFLTAIAVAWRVEKNRSAIVLAATRHLTLREGCSAFRSSQSPVILRVLDVQKDRGADAQQVPFRTHDRLGNIE